MLCEEEVMTTPAENKYDAPSPLNIPKRQIFAFASAASEKLGLSAGDPIEPIVSDLGGKIGYLDFDAWIDDKSGRLEVYANGTFTINISAFSGPLRNRFTIAHELGHYFLHSRAGKIPIRVERRVGESDRLEWEANWFAAGFLMPEQEFRKAIKLFNADINRVAAYFQVSTQAAMTRKKDLGC
jgi:Zn-dependent peptidase ImmA (M78 family)